MPSVHPTAVLQGDVQLDDDVVVGPYCILTGPIRIGAGTELVGHVAIQGPVVIGAACRLLPFVAVGFEPQHTGYEGGTAGVVLGDRCCLRESATVHAALSQEQPTRLGADVMMMSTSHVGHDARIDDHVILTSSALIGGHAEVHAHAIVGGNASVHQFCRVGVRAMLGGGSSVASDLPPFSVATGMNRVTSVNRIALRRAGVDRAAIDQVVQAYDLLYMQRLARPTAVRQLRQLIAEGVPGAEQLALIADFVDTTERGLAPHAAVRTGDRLR